MKLAKDDVIAALRVRYDYYSAQTMFDVARERAGLPDQPAYVPAEVVAFTAALKSVGDRVGAVEARLTEWLDAAGGAPAAAPTPKADAPKAEPAKADDKRAEAKHEDKKAEAKHEDKKADKHEAKKADKHEAKADKHEAKADAKAEGKKGETIETVIALSGVDAKDGDVVMVCGGFAELGDWDPARARPMTKTGDQWLATVKLAPDTEIAFKFFRKTADGSVIWEDGDNRNAIAKPRIDATWR